VAQSGIASTPTQVHARGESGRHCRAGGPSDSHRTAELKVMDDASGNSGLARLTRRRERQQLGEAHEGRIEHADEDHSLLQEHG
jgi:hypothetical protein